MATTEIKQEAPIFPTTAPVVPRNGVSLTLEAQVLGKMHDKAGQRFWAPVIDVSNPDHVAWAVAESLSSIVNKELRLIFADIYLSAMETKEEGGLVDSTTGKYDPEEMKARLEADWADFTAGVSRLADLQDQIDILQDQMSPIALDPDYCAPEEGEQPSPRFIELAGKMRELGKRIKPLRTQLNNIKEVYKIRAAKRKDREAKSKTKTQAPANVTQG